MREAEISVLGGVLLEPKAFEQVVDILKPEYFTTAQHRTIFDAICHQFQQGAPFDVISLAEFLGESKWLSTLGAIAHRSWSTANIQTYARAVRDSHFKRQIAQAAQQVIAAANSNSKSADLIEILSSTIMSIEDESKIRPSARSVGEVLNQTIIDLQERHALNGKILGLGTGLPDLDNKINGLQQSKLYIIAGRPGMGKTILAENIATHNALNEKRVLFFSLEMSAEECIDRSLASTGGVDFKSIQNASVLNDDNKFTILSNAIHRLKNTPCYFIDDTPALSISEIRARTTSFARQNGGVDLILFDYLQLITAKAPNRYEEVSLISRELKRLAKDFKCPVVALSQLSRKVEERSNKRPVVADLRESGQIEQDADFIGFVYRDEVYNPDTQGKGLAELITGKNRGGICEDVLMVFQGHLQRFASATADQWHLVQKTQTRTPNKKNFQNFQREEAF